MNVIDKFHQGVKSRIRTVLRKATLLDKITAVLLPPDKDEISDPTKLAKTTILFGAWMVFLVFGVFGLWSALAPLESYAIAQGRVVVDSNRKTISHLEGGIVEDIMVSDGMVVEKGAELIRLREIRAKATVELLEDRYLSNLAIESRLLAERDGKKSIAFHKDLTEQQHLPEAKELLDNQRRIFNSRRENLEGQLSILKTQVAKSEEVIKGLELQATSMRDQIALLDEEIEVVEALVEKGHATKARLLSLKRQKAELQGREGEYMALKAKERESIDETRLAILNTESEYMNKVVEELKTIQLQLAEVREKIKASSDVLDRIVIRAPERGIVNDLTAHTIGGVVQPGAKIMDLIPIDDQLIVEAHVLPRDIDVVRPGLNARVRLTAYKVRQVPSLNGEVIFVAADQLTDERTGQSYFTARVRINKEELEELEGIELYPGMPADVNIINGSRTFLAYMVGPITDSFNQSFREQ